MEQPMLIIHPITEVDNDLFFAHLAPYHATIGSKGMDLRAYIPPDPGDHRSTLTIIPYGTSRIIRTGIRMEVPEGYEVQIRSRSGLAAQDIVVANSPGTIDSDYEGEIKVILFNHSSTDKVFHMGDRVAQAVLVKLPTEVPIMYFDQSPIKILNNDRKTSGFGSTGI